MAAVRELAAEALKSFEKGAYFRNLHKYRSGEYFALVGLLQGVADGTITVGQSWAAELLMAKQITPEDTDIQEYDVGEPEAVLLKAVFASGICCEGQPLKMDRMKTHLQNRKMLDTGERER